MNDAAFQRYFGHSTDLICLVGADGRFQDLNPAFTRMLGQPKSELLPHALVDFVHPEDRAETLAKLSLTADQDTGVDLRNRCRDSDESWLWLEWNMMSVTSGTLCVGHDITKYTRIEEELKTAQEELLRAEKLAVLGQLAGSVAHEMRNPLGVIGNSVYYLTEAETNLANDSRECLQDIRREVATANRIVGELLDFARSPTSEPEVVGCPELIEDAIAMLELPADINVNKDTCDSCVVEADRGQLSRVLRNLMLNAIQAMDGKGTLTVSCRSEGERVVFSVADTGPGIPKEERKKIFEPLVSTKARGIGLGLPLSRQYAELNGGTLSVDSAHGQGAVFLLSLPLRQSEPNP